MTAEQHAATRRHAGRRALVTGGATGIGRSTVGRLGAEGAAVVVNYIGDPAPAEEAVSELEEAGGKAIAVQADVSNEEQVVSMFSRAREELGGPIDLLVNNAGIEKPDRKSTRLNSSHSQISYAVFCLKKKTKTIEH